MGWNSWDCYGTTVTEAEVLANAEFMADHLLHFGWDTIVVDIAWYDPAARAGGYNEKPGIDMDAWGRQLPATNRFPSAADGGGFAPLADRVHALGLRFGLHIMRGIPRTAVERALPVFELPGVTAADIADPASSCSWNPDNVGLNHAHPGAQAYYDAQVAQFAAWGVDFIKADDMLAPYHSREIEAYALAIARSGRPITLSLSPGTDLSLAHRDHLAGHAVLWRVSDDLWDRWEDIMGQFGRLARWAPHQRPGAWAGSDMLPLGRIGIRAERGEDRMSRLTPDEQRTMLTLWCVARSPLMFGGDLPSTPPETLALLTNPAVLRMHRDSHGQRELWRDDDTVVWSSVAGAEVDEPAALHVAVFNTGNTARDIHLPLSALGAPDRAATATDLWDGGQVTVADGGLTLRVPAHGCRLMQFSPPSTPGR
ncbi:glycoside hydrolase family 27 protein [Cryobacterium adonitolivorans]|uniref:Alpha-galactosidase n=2 Tax=Cryobacterium adonitolivorans TaxID=1259189 RepID=A0A4R8WAY5_9MICO|nr:glycoside hydrolase family 27 protein [Cryobacterium adonitolivorans]